MSKININVSSSDQIKSLLLRDDFSNTFDSLLKHFEDIENTPDYSIEFFINNFVIYMIQSDIKSAKLLLERCRLKNELFSKNENTFNSLSKIIRIFEFDPFNNIYTELNEIKRFCNNNIYSTFLNQFECEQALFISKIYSCISKNTLMSYLNPHYNNKTIDEYIKKFNLVEIKDKSGDFLTFENFNLNTLDKETGLLKSNLSGLTLKNYDTNKRDLHIFGLNATLLDKQVKSINSTNNRK